MLTSQQQALLLHALNEPQDLQDVRLLAVGKCIICKTRLTWKCRKAMPMIAILQGTKASVHEGAEGMRSLGCSSSFSPKAWC